MKIGILSKRTTTLAGRMKEYFEELGHSVYIYTADNLCINSALLNHDFFILKSKKIIYIYAGFFIEASNVRITPNPQLTYQHKYRIDAHYLIRQAGLLSPDFYVGTKYALEQKLLNEKNIFPIVSKPLMDSGSQGVHFINNLDELYDLDDEIVYFERKIKGTHYIIYFIENEICLAEKPPLSTEHVEMKQVIPSKEIIRIVNIWKKCYQVQFGHLDVIKEEKSNKIYVVDPGTFPEFTNWKQGDDPCPKICEIILNQIKY